MFFIGCILFGAYLHDYKQSIAVEMASIGIEDRIDVRPAVIQISTETVAATL
jgi:hypothetical protein